MLYHLENISHSAGTIEPDLGSMLVTGRFWDIHSIIGTGFHRKSLQLSPAPSEFRPQNSLQQSDPRRWNTSTRNVDHIFLNWETQNKIYLHLPFQKHRTWISTVDLRYIYVYIYIYYIYIYVRSIVSIAVCGWFHSTIFAG